MIAARFFALLLAPLAVIEGFLFCLFEATFPSEPLPLGFMALMAAVCLLFGAAGAVADWVEEAGHRKSEARFLARRALWAAEDAVAAGSRRVTEADVEELRASLEAMKN